MNRSSPATGTNSAARSLRFDAAATASFTTVAAAMHDELMPLAESIIGYAQIVANDAEEYPAHYRADLEKLQSSARALHSFLKNQMEDARQQPEPADYQQQLKHLRHDIGNLLSHVAGFTQLLLMEESEELFGAFTADLAKIKELCEDGELVLSQYKLQEMAEAAFEQLSDVQESPQASRLEIPAAVAPAKVVEPASVLVADDNEGSRDLLARVLQRKGHKVSVAASGKEAIEILRQQEFDLVLMDFIMPEMNGYEALRVIKEDERLRHTPVVIVSALNTVHEIVACIEIGAEDFLTKPVDVKLLEARVNACLEKKRLREREFGQFFTPELARHFVRHPELLKSGHEAEVSILFCDIRKFSGISERLGPSDTVSWLSEVMETLSDCVIEQRGVLVDYIGDELMAMWGAPEEQPDHAQRACQAAITMLARLPALSSKWLDVVGEPTRVGIGINTGPARVGNTGSRRKFKYGALGNSVNLASRVQGATKYFGTDLLVTGDTFRQCAARFPARRLCRVRVVNIEKPVELYEVFLEGGDAAQDLRQRYERALDEFELGRFAVAASILGNLLVDFPHDRPALQLMSRVAEMLLHEPDSFDPVTELQSK